MGQATLVYQVARSSSDIIVDSFNDVTLYAEKHKVDNRVAAYMLAIDRVAYVIRQRGTYA